ncbi:MAG: TonB-dependent receptor [Gammaproteobacteria bacterium]|nr:TonB-dependent receptor [Gammaproteobacteria bacterium]
MTNDKFSCFLLLLCCISMSMPLWAESSADKKASIAKIRALTKLTLRELMEVKIQVASKNEETTADAPSSVTVFTHHEIRNMGITALGELLDFVPGYQSFRLALNGDSQGFQVRGSPLLPVFSRDVLVLVDGRRLNGSHSGGAVLYNAHINTDNIEQVEIIRGPGSALYGSNAFLGVINIITDSNRNEAMLRLGTQARKEALLNTSYGKGDWHTAVFVRSFADNGEIYHGLTERSGRTGSARDEQRGWDGNALLRYKNLELRLRHTARNSNDFLDSEYLGDNGINTSENRQSSVNLACRWEPGEDWKAEIRGGYTLSKLYFLSAAGTQTETGYPELFGLSLENDAFNLDLDLSWNPAPEASWRAGFTYENTGNTDNALIAADAAGQALWLRGDNGFTENRDRDIIGIYLQHQRFLRTDLKLVAGLRYDDYSDFGASFNPRTALIYTTPWDGRLKLMYGEAFRAPSIADISLKLSNSQGNPNLDPEKAASLELAYVHTRPWGQVTLTGFQNEITDIIAVEADEQGIFGVSNKDGLTRRGLELEARWKLADSLMLRGTYSRIIDTVTRHAPKDFASWMLNWEHGRWNLNVNGTYQGKLATLASPRETWLANTSLRYRLKRGMTVQVTVSNLFDTAYYDPPEFSSQVDGVLRSLEPGVPNRGRNAWAGLEWVF